MSTLLLIIVLCILAFVLGLLEIYILPGFGIAGFCAAACGIAAVALIGATYGTLAACLALVGGLLLLFAALYHFSRSQRLKRVSLSATLTSTAATAAQLAVQVGDEGCALTRLALVGNAEIGGKAVEVKSVGGFVPEGTRVRVVAVSEALISVRPITD